MYPRLCHNMKTGIISDGSAEAQALKYLVAKMKCGNFTPLKPVYADMQPCAPIPQIVRAAQSRIALLNQRGAERNLVVLDREGSAACPGEFASRLRDEFVRKGMPNVSVVMKDRAFENWLIADMPSLVRGSHRRINVSDRIIQRISLSGADNVNALAILNGCVKDGYNKRRDAIEICRTVDPEVLARNSRSFRKFLSVIKEP
jgi:hypothetical protein